MKNKLKTKVHHVVLLFLIFSISSVWAATISKEQVTTDVEFLAKDELKGRANFSTEIEQAADYIDSRFSEIGLTHIAGLKSFKQTFSITKIQPKEINIILNGKSIQTENLAMASTIESISWQDKNDFSTHILSAEQDMRKNISQLNMEGGNHLVLLNTAHADMFSRYQSYFNRGLTKLSLDNQGAILVILTDELKINAIDVQATVSFSHQKLTNMVGILPGKSKPEEIVLFSAHYDHLGEKSDATGDHIYNGADDDASGTAAVMNLAQHFAKRSDNERTLMFTAFAAEEIGGYGSKYFSEHLDPNKVIAMINIEMIGKASKFGEGTVWMTGMERSDLGKLLNNNLLDKGKKIYQDPYPEQKLFYRSDNATLARLGVPAHSFSTTQLDKDQHYHQVSD
ncbi:MAG: M20/M25/M40 family metallo-hydrolase, partial [Gammaproteobacteria bacterium]|nr:M20/M25/M40 family metallo-hydrolase [Gammaproteobacteria bacterium]